MNYRTLFYRVWQLLTAPALTWQEIREEEESEPILPAFVYPLIGLCAFAEFFGIFIRQGWERALLQAALIQCTSVAVAYFGGFFLSSFLLEKWGPRVMRKEIGHEDYQRFVGYSMVVILVLGIAQVLMSILVLRLIFSLYTILIVFEGLRVFLKVEERRLLPATVLAAVVILVSPPLIEYLFNKLSLILN